VHNQGVGSWTARRARKTPHRVAVVYEGREWTYRELHERVTRLAHALRGLGVRRGDRVAYLGPNHPAYLETLFAAGVTGAVFVPLNPRLAGPELAHVLADSGSRVLIAAPAFAETVAKLRVEVHLDAFVTVDGTSPPAIGYERLLASARTDPIDEPVSHEDLCLIMYTSGTTGRPKGAMLSHGNIIWNSVNVVVDCDLAGDEVALLCAPLFHTAGLNMTCLPVMLKGGTVVLVAAFEPARMLDLIEEHRVTFMFGVPAMYNAMSASPRWPGADLSSLRTLTCGGAPVPGATIGTYLRRGLTFIQGYGMTEASPGVLLLDKDQVTKKAGSAGVPHFFSDVRVVRPDRSDTAPGEKGEVVVQGPNVMKGYWGQPEATVAAMGDGAWFHSGDVAVVDEDGYVFIVDRVKDMIISGGENVYPAEVEDALYAHPAVAECAVIGVPDERWGEVGRAVVVRRSGVDATEEELLGFLVDRLAGYKIPKSVRFVGELPRSGTGKVFKKHLRE
jgi:fatty-acyl-CoA synthase